MRPKVEMLEHHAERRACLGEFPLAASSRPSGVSRQPISLPKTSASPSS